jgi:hypothetical protein
MSIDGEGMQRRAARFVKRCYDRTPESVIRLLNELQWPLLEQRRKEARLTMMYKAVNGKIALQIPEYVQPKQRITRQYHPMKFTHLTPASNTYKFSFYARTIPEWSTHFLLKRYTNSVLRRLGAVSSPFYFNSHLATFISYLFFSFLHLRSP